MRKSLKKIVCIVGVACVHLLLLLAKDIQEDACITFRVAFNLADHGVFSFNLDEHYNSVTSFLYPLGIACVRLVLGGFAIPVVQVINALAVLWTCWIVAKILRDLFDIEEKYQCLTWFLLSLLPHTLVLSVRSMEMPYVVLLFVLVLRGLQRQTRQREDGPKEVQNPNESLGFCLVGLLPFVRPDAVAFSFIAVGVAFLIRPILSVRYLVATLVGIAVYGIANYWLWGSVLPNTIAAKTISYNGLSFSGLFSSWCLVMNEVAFPVDVKQLYLIKPFCGVIAAAIMGSLLRMLWIKRKEHFPILLGIVVAIFAIPSVYVLGGVIFPWYLWPAQFLCTGILTGSAVYIINRLKHLVAMKVSWALLVGSVIMMMSLQLARSYNWGVMEGRYRANIGTYIAGVSSANDTLFLEPAGYIPFYAGLKTIDEIGLASPIVLKYKRESPENWWLNCVKKERPTFLVQREHFVDHRTHHGYQLKIDEIVWFDQHYALMKRFCYTPQEYTDHAFLVRLLKLSKTHDYYVYKLRERSALVD